MNAPTDFAALKARQQAAWASGDYAVIGTSLQLVGELLAEACDLHCDERVLDVARGTGRVGVDAAARKRVQQQYVDAISTWRVGTGYRIPGGFVVLDASLAEPI